MKGSGGASKVTRQFPCSRYEEFTWTIKLFEGHFSYCMVISGILSQPRYVALRAGHRRSISAVAMAPQLRLPGAYTTSQYDMLCYVMLGCVTYDM